MNKTKTVLALYEKGWSNKEIAKQVDLSTRTVSRIISKSGEGRKAGRPRKILDSTIKRVYHLTETGRRTVEEVADALGVSPQTIRNTLDEYRPNGSTESDR